MLLGSADDWDGYETFHPETEVCAARVVHPVLEELQVVNLPATLDTEAEQGKVVKLDRPGLSKLPNILGGRDGCQVCWRGMFASQLILLHCSGRLWRTSLEVEGRQRR